MSCTATIFNITSDCAKKQFGGYEAIVALFSKDEFVNSQITKTATSEIFEINDNSVSTKSARIGYTSSPAENVAESVGGYTPFVISQIPNKGVTYTIETQDGDTQFTQGTLTIKIDAKAGGEGIKHSIFTDNNLYSKYAVVIFGLDGVVGILDECKLTSITFDGGADVTDFAGYTLTFTQMFALDNSIFTAGVNGGLARAIREMFSVY